jgi:cbb3-type cytochrome oxidase subunit 3
MSDSPPPEGAGRSAFVFNPWNLLLLLPVLMLVTPWFNRATPQIGGLPFFYWYQFAFVLVGVGCVWIVYLTTRKQPHRTDEADRLNVDDLDEGGRS